MGQLVFGFEREHIKKQMSEPDRTDTETHNGRFAVAQYDWWKDDCRRDSPHAAAMYNTAQEYLTHLVRKYAREKQVRIPRELRDEKIEDMCAWLFEQAVKQPINRLSAYGYFAFLKIMHDKKTVEYEQNIILDTDYMKEKEEE